MACTHAELIRRTRDVRAAARSRAPGDLEREVAELLQAFIDHVHDERLAVLHLPTFSARLVERGQQRILGELIELSLEADAVDDHCRCAELAEEVALQVLAHVEAEERAFARSRA